MLSLTGAFAENHDLRLLVLAGLIGLLASYTAFSMMARLYSPRSRYPWVVAAAVVTGCGAWATQAIALLAYTPGVPVAYRVDLTLLAGLVGVLGSGLGFHMARSTERMALGGAIVGFAIGAMHAIGMSGLMFQAQVGRDILYDEIGIIVAASFGAAALSRAQLSPDLGGRIIASILLTLGICGAHLAGISGLTVIPDFTIAMPQDTLAIVWFSIALTAVVLLILGFGIMGVLIDQHIREIEAHKRQLETALVSADAANASKTKFLSTMSHELRSPLNVIIGFSELMTKENYDGRQTQFRDHAGNILNSGVHLLRLVNDILDISRFDAGHLNLSEDIIDVGECITSCVETFAAEAEKAQLRLSANLPEGSPQLRGDAKRIRQILSNLISNAIRFTPKGGEVRVSAFQQDEALILSVTDTGIGMTNDDIPKALERFGQIDSELSRKYEGAGLGLPLAQHLMELHGGGLRIESEPGTGTVVSAFFPPSRVVRPALALHAAA